MRFKCASARVGPRPCNGLYVTASPWPTWVLAPSQGVGGRQDPGSSGWPLALSASVRPERGYSCAELKGFADGLRGLPWQTASAPGDAAERSPLATGPQSFCLGEPLPVHLVGHELQGQHTGLLGSCTAAFSLLTLAAGCGGDQAARPQFAHG